MTGIRPSQFDDAVQVKPYADTHAEAWRRYVHAHPSATVFHMEAWSRAVEKTYGHRPMHLTAWSAGRLVGVLPLFMVKSIFVGRVLVSIPYATYGGILADSDEAAKAILIAADELAGQTGAEYVELRHRDANKLGLPEIERYDTFRKTLPERPEDVLPSLPKKTRAAARKGLKALTVKTGPELLDPVYDLYSFTMRRLGSPNFKRRFFHELQDGYSEDCVCLVVKDGGEAVAGVISYVFRGEIVPYFSGSLPEGMHKNANNVMYLKLMEYAIERGLRRFDFNRTRRDNRGPHAFKRYHGFEPSALHYQVSLNKAKDLPNLSPSNRKYALAGRVWRKLPLWFTRSAGGRITKWIP
ncbi:MAG: FemAB family XrtA/PEP-CTERM system-associated protein [Planctomycetota bacterium]|nr:FemAB family XrtA/PEP-CTERM system-associated protein [Planctomycetota bacterium]